MNYIALINSFWDSATTNPLSTGQVSLYFALLHVCNRSNWTEWFQAPNQVLSVLTGLSRSGILKARNELKQRGLIDFRERGTKATFYRIGTIANSTQVGVQDSTQNGVQNGTQNGVQNSNTLNKQINKQKQKLKKEKGTKVPKEEIENFFNAIWNLYPVKRGKGSVSDAQKQRLYELGQEQIKKAIDRYLTDLKKDTWRKPQNGSTFFNSGYKDYLDGEYTREGDAADAGWGSTADFYRQYLSGGDGPEDPGMRSGSGPMPDGDL